MKKIIYKFITLILAFSALFCFSACEEQEILVDYVTELRCDVFEGNSESYTVKAGYGYKNVTKNYRLTVKLTGNYNENVTYTIKLDYLNQTYKSDFKYNPVKGSLTAEIEIDNFTEKQFDVVISAGPDNQTVTLSSVLPENTIDYVTALKFLREHQSELIDAYTSADGTFQADIILRVLVKEEKPYWYVGLLNGDKNLKALLIDGINGEVLAVREIL